MEFNENHSELLSIGKAPILLEPVKLTLSINRKEKPTITVLDHLGNKTSQTIQNKKGKWLLNSSETKAIYYLIEY